jgi:hypothetical protein
MTYQAVRELQQFSAPAFYTQGARELISVCRHECQLLLLPVIKKKKKIALMINHVFA